MKNTNRDVNTQKNNNTRQVQYDKRGVGLPATSSKPPMPPVKPPKEKGS